MQKFYAGTLKPYVPTSQRPWNEQRIGHLYRRLTYGETTANQKNALRRNPQHIVDHIVGNAANKRPTPAPSWHNTYKSQYQNRGMNYDDENRKNRHQWFTQTVKDQSEDGLHGIMTLFWHNHFVTRLDEYVSSTYMYHYYNTLQKYAMGDFRVLVKKIGLTFAMLRYLNGFSNRKDRPNENYARELFELFTLGENRGYTQKDITETARALTGYNKGKSNDPLHFDPKMFDDSEKIIFGRKGNWNYDQVIDILFEERGKYVAEFIVGKIYKHFVNPKINVPIVRELARDFAKDFKIAPILRKLFKSEHFFDESNIGVMIKSPYDLSMNLIKTLNIRLTDQRMGALYWIARRQGQAFFNPVDVAGWQGDWDWISTSTLNARWQQTVTILWFATGANEAYRIGNMDKLRKFAKNVSNNSTDPDYVTRRIVDTLIPRGFYSKEDYVTAADVFRMRYPENHYTSGIWNLNIKGAPEQVRDLLQYLFKHPEFQTK